MKFTDICIKRPVFTIVLSIIIVVLGYVTFQQLQVRQYPRIEYPKVSVRTQVEGASPQIIETQVTKILEDSFAGIEGLYSMSSASSAGESRITLTFNLNRKIESAVNDIRDKIGRNRNRLPQDATDPIIRKADADAVPIIFLALHSKRHKIINLADYAYRFLESKFEVLPGVSSIDIFGGGELEMRIILDSIKMANFGVVPEDVVYAIRRQNLEKPAGSIKTANEEIIVTTKASLVSEKDFENVVLANKNGSLLKVGDVGRAELAMQDTKSIVRFNDRSAIGIALTKQSTANPLSIAKELYKILPNLQKSLPPGMKLEIAEDRTIFVDKSITEVYRTIFEATLLVIAVILLFLRSFRAVVIPIVTIPVSIIGTFFLMYIFGFTINILTLLALVLAIGLVVDDAIVMLENIYRYIEKGMSPIQASFKGAKEISFAVIAMTITLAAVYAPIALSPGNIGKLFTEFALTLAGSVMISGFVALTLSPMMCGRLLKAHKAKKVSNVKNNDGQKIKLIFWHKIDLAIEIFFKRVDIVYAQLLTNLLNIKCPLISKKLMTKISLINWVKSLKLLKFIKMFSKIFITGHWLSVFFGLFLALLGYIAFISTNKEFLPREDQGQISVRMVPLTNNASVDFIDKYVKQGEIILKQLPEVLNILTVVTSLGETSSLAVLVPWSERNRSAMDIATSIRLPLWDIVGLNSSAYAKSSGLGVGGGAQTRFSIVITSTKTFSELTKKAYQANRALNKTGWFIKDTLEPNISADTQEYIVTVDREKAAHLGVSVEQIASSLATLVGGKPISKFKKDNKQFGVKVQLDEAAQSSIEKLTNIFIKGEEFSAKNGGRRETQVALSEVVQIQKRLAPVEIPHLDAFRAVSISGRIKSGYDLSDVINKSLEIVTKAVGDESTQVVLAGQSRRLVEEGKNILEIFGLALLFIFLVLAAQYESWRDPWIILLSVPLSLAGGAFFLKFFGETVNLYSQIGFITLIGLITKHGILIVDFANKLKEQGLGKLEAVIQSSRMRLRPILMTTFAMVLGALPLALASGAGMENRRPIGLVIVGGMIIGTIFTLFVLPAVYVIISRKKNREQLEDQTDATITINK